MYDQYHFDEPWDSENNKKVLKYRPAQLLSPINPTSTNTAYFAMVGPGTIFEGKEGVGVREITDGTSDTILAVEAKRDIPWTKPEDIPYSPDKPLPKLGGFTEGGFNVAYCDGHTLLLPNDINQQTFRHLIEKADGNPVDRSEFLK